MQQSSKFLTECVDSFHEHTVHDISFDYYSKRLATCSSDSKIKIWDKTKDGWVNTGGFPAHNGPVWKVKWAHPNFGTILATCSYDKQVIIWEEQKINKFIQNNVQDTSTMWKLLTKFCDSKESIEDIKFGPKHLGLILATASSEGTFRVYYAPDTMQLSSWQFITEIFVSPFGLNSLSWCKNPFMPSMLAIGCKDIQTSFQKKYFQAQDQQQPQAKNFKFKYAADEEDEDENLINKNNSNDHFCIYFQDPTTQQWKFLRSLKYLFSENDKQIEEVAHKSAVNDISWANQNGRSYDMIATCGKDGVFIWFVKYIEEKQEIDILKTVTLNKQTEFGFWKVSWNVMSTILASSDEENVVRLWKNKADGQWLCIQEIVEDENAEIQEKEFKKM